MSEQTAAMAASKPSFASEGYAVLPGVVSPPLLAGLHRLTGERLSAEEPSHFEQFKYHGSMLPLDPISDELVRRLVTLATTRQGLADLGFSDPKWLSAYLISKPARSPSLWWHQDWWAWDDMVSFADFPPQLFVMYYLCDVDEDNGALRVIPGSHRCQHALHRVLPAAHSRDISLTPTRSAVHEQQPDEITIKAKAGDAVIGDVRLLHSTHPNWSGDRRTCITLWYLPRYSALPESIKAYVVMHPAQPPADWWRRPDPLIPEELRGLLPTYDGNGTPARYNRRPPDHWPI